jgi:outer membrane protein insertion porin family
VKVPGVSLIFRWAALAVVAVLAFGTPAYAQRASGTAGTTISAVQIQGNVRSEVDTIKSYLQLKEGQAYDPVAADRSLKALFSTGLYSDVSIDMQGSTLVVKVVENPIINRVAFEGNRKIDDDKLREPMSSGSLRSTGVVAAITPLSNPRSSGSSRVVSISCSRSAKVM